MRIFLWSACSFMGPESPDSSPLCCWLYSSATCPGYYWTHLIHSVYGGTLRKVLLFLSVALTLSFLFYYKYAVFLITNLNEFFGTGFNIPNIVLPIGISFFTFQSMSYVVDVYRREIPAQKNPLSLALYVSLFPQLIAGPIVRYADIRAQITDRRIDLELFASGVRRFIIGLAKKVLIANILGETADKIFALQYGQISVSSAWLGALCYTMQIYFDFSGYSDMAIGLGRMFGFEFLENFNLPYISRSITEFWRRWHISLSTWFRDYVYIPLGGNRKGNVYLHLFIVFVLTGLWHGAAWNFLFWGLWHGMFLIIERPFRVRKMNINAPAFLKWGYTMLVVMLGWVLFRAESLTQAYQYALTMFGIAEYGFIPFDTKYYLDHRTVAVLVAAIFVSSDIPSKIYDRLTQKSGCRENVCLLAENAALITLLAVSAIFIVNSSYNPFIYFRF